MNKTVSPAENIEPEKKGARDAGRPGKETSRPDSVGGRLSDTDAVISLEFGPHDITSIQKNKNNLILKRANGNRVRSYLETPRMDNRRCQLKAPPDTGVHHGVRDIHPKWAPSKRLSHGALTSARMVVS